VSTSPSSSRFAELRRGRPVFALRQTLGCAAASMFQCSRRTVCDECGSAEADGARGFLTTAFYSIPIRYCLKPLPLSRHAMARLQVSAVECGSANADQVEAFPTVARLPTLPFDACSPSASSAFGVQRSMFERGASRAPLQRSPSNLPPPQGPVPVQKCTFGGTATDAVFVDKR
jgi:hypothetical protein